MRSLLSKVGTKAYQKYGKLLEKITKSTADSSQTSERKLRI